MLKKIGIILLVCFVFTACGSNQNNINSNSQSSNGKFKVGDLVFASRNGSTDGEEYVWSKIEKINGDEITVERIDSSQPLTTFTTYSHRLVPKANCGNKPVKVGDAVIYQAPGGEKFFLSKITSYSGETIDVSLVRNSRGRLMLIKEYENRKPVTYWCVFDQPFEVQNVY